MIEATKEQVKAAGRRAIIDLQFGKSVRVAINREEQAERPKAE
jgi:hypothetical protein